MEDLFLQRLHEEAGTVLMHQGKRYFAITTTANLNNPPEYVASTKLTPFGIVGNVILRRPDRLTEVLECLDGKIDAFLVDAEQKSELKDLPDRIRALSPRSSVRLIQPNGITLLAFECLLGELIPDPGNKSVAVLGAGNLGVKTSLSCCERGFQVRLWGRNYEKTSTIAKGLAAFSRGLTTVQAIEQKSEALHAADLVLGCTPGIPAIDVEDAGAIEPSATVIDIGNGTIAPDAITLLQEKSCAIYCLNPKPGYEGYLAALEATMSAVANMGFRQISDSCRILSPGLIGRLGDIIVDDIFNYQRVIGVCDGRGDLLPEQQAQAYIQEFRHLTRK